MLENEGDWIEVKKKERTINNEKIKDKKKIINNKKEYLMEDINDAKSIPEGYENYPQHNNHPFKVGDRISAIMPNTFNVWRPCEIVEVDEINRRYLIKAKTLVPINGYVDFEKTKYIKIPGLTKKEKINNAKYGYVIKTKSLPGYRKATYKDFHISESEKKFLYKLVPKLDQKKCDISCINDGYCYYICVCCNPYKISRILKRNVYECGKCSCCCGGDDNIDNPALDNIKNEYLIVHTEKRDIKRMKDEDGFEYNDWDNNKAYLPYKF